MGCGGCPLLRGPCTGWISRLGLLLLRRLSAVSAVLERERCLLLVGLGWLGLGLWGSMVCRRTSCPWCQRLAIRSHQWQKSLLMTKKVAGSAQYFASVCEIASTWEAGGWPTISGTTVTSCLRSAASVWTYLKMCRRCGNCISSECSSSSTDGFASRKSPVSRSSEITTSATPKCSSSPSASTFRLPSGVPSVKNGVRAIPRM